jgi:hypothetical protein
MYMRYLIQSQNAENLQKALAYAESLGVEILPLPEEPPKEKKHDFSFASLCMRVSPEVSKEIHEELDKIHNDWE